MALTLIFLDNKRFTIFTLFFITAVAIADVFKINQEFHNHK